MRLNDQVVHGVASPITEAYAWLAGLDDSPEAPPVLDVAQAVPGYPPADDLMRYLASIAEDPAVSRYGPVLGLPELRAAFADDVQRAYDAAIAPDQVAITAGCNQAFCLAMAALARAGDEVILVAPYYFNHDMWLRMQGITPRYLMPEAGFTPTPDATAALVTDRTRAVVVITPNNPTGSITSPDVLEALADLCREREIALVLDETYRDFRESTAPAHALFLRSDWGEHVIHLYSFSKVFSITGYRVGALAASPAVLEHIDKLADCVTICPPIVSQHAALYGLRHLADWVEDNRRLMVRRLHAFRAAMAEAESGYEVAASGAYFAYVRHPFEQSSRAVARRLLHEQRLLALPGDMFGPGQDRYLRIAFANVDDVATIADRLAASTR